MFVSFLYWGWSPGCEVGSSSDVEEIEGEETAVDSGIG